MEVHQNVENKKGLFENLITAVGDMHSTVDRLQSVKQYSESIRRFCDTWSDDIKNASDRIYELLSHFGEEEYRTPIKTAVDDYEKAWAKGAQQFQTLKVRQKWKKELETFINRK